MTHALVKAEIESALGSRFGSPFHLHEKLVPEAMSTGVPEVDSLTGLPRGAITEICGPTSSGRTSLLYSVLAEATACREVCALVDTSDALDPASAVAAGVDLDLLLWVRCAANMEQALKATDLLLQGGGLGLVLLDLGDVSPQQARRIPFTSWFRFRRAIENTPTALLVMGQEPYAQSCASLVLEMSRASATWSGTSGRDRQESVPTGRDALSYCGSRLLRGARIQVERRKPTKCGVHLPALSGQVASCGSNATFEVRFVA